MEVAKQKACIKYADYKQMDMVADLKSLDTMIKELEELRKLLVKGVMSKQKEIENRKRLVKSY